MNIKICLSHKNGMPVCLPVLHQRFTCKFFVQIFCQSVTRKRCQKGLSYKFFVRITLMKLTPGGFYALLAAHMASLLLNWDADTLMFRQRMRKGKPAKAIQVIILATLYIQIFCTNIVFLRTCN
jgi:hypothetical protein